MQRRDILQKCVGVATVGGLAALAGCTGSDADEGGTAVLERAGLDYAKGESGGLVVTVDVKNVGDAEGKGTLYVTVSAGDDVTRESKSVTVPAGETTTLELAFDLSYETFEDDGSIDTDLRT